MWPSPRTVRGAPGASRRLRFLQRELARPPFSQHKNRQHSCRRRRPLPWGRACRLRGRLGASRFCLWDLAESSRLARFPLREGGRGRGVWGPVGRPAPPATGCRHGTGAACEGWSPAAWVPWAPRSGPWTEAQRAVSRWPRQELRRAKRPVGTKERPPRPRAMGSGRALCQETRWVLCFGRGRLCGLLRWPEGARGEDGAAAPLRAREGRPARRVGGGSFEEPLPVALETR